MNSSNIQSKKAYIANAFSLQMVDLASYDVHVLSISEGQFNALSKTAISIVGHADTARVLNVQMNRQSVILNPGDMLLVAQLQGGRLPEGATALPEGVSFKYLKVTVSHQTEKE